MPRAPAALALLGLFAWLTPSGAAPPAGLGARCGGVAGPVCAEGLRCEPPAGMCNVSDAPGTCVKPGRSA